MKDYIESAVFPRLNLQLPSAERELEGKRRRLPLYLTLDQRVDTEWQKPGPVLYRSRRERKDHAEVRLPTMAELRCTTAALRPDIRPSIDLAGTVPIEEDAAEDAAAPGHASAAAKATAAETSADRPAPSPRAEAPAATPKPAGVPPAGPIPATSANAETGKTAAETRLQAPAAAPEGAGGTGAPGEPGRSGRSEETPAVPPSGTAAASGDTSSPAEGAPGGSAGETAKTPSTASTEQSGSATRTAQSGQPEPRQASASTKREAPEASGASAGPAASGPTGETAKPDPEAADAGTPAADRAEAAGGTDPEGAKRGETVARDGGGGIGVTIEGNTGPIRRTPEGGGPDSGGGGGKSPPPKFHKRKGPQDFGQSLRRGMLAVRRNMGFVMALTLATNLLILAIPVYLFQISDRVLTSRSVDTLIMLTIVIIGAVILQAMFDALRRFILMRTAVEVAVRLGAPILSAASHASLHGTGREYQTLGDLQQLRGFLVSGTLLSFLDVPFAPIFITAVFLVHPHLGTIVICTAMLLLVIALVNQKLTGQPFSEANFAQAKANQHLDSMSRNSQIINALAMIPEAVTIWGRDTAASLTAQVRAQDRNIVTSAVSRVVRMLTQVTMLGWGAYLSLQGEITGGMVIAASIIAGRALAPIEGAIEGWNGFIMARSSYGRIAGLLTSSKLQYEKLNLPQPQGRLDVERLLFVPSGTKQVVLNGINFSLNPGESLAIIGNSGAGKTTLGKMLVGSILPTSGNVRLDLMDLRNWDPRQFGENIGYLPQDVQLFPGSIKDNIGRMRQDATDAQIYRAAMLADVHEMIANLPQGYETMVSADGSPLSGGQKQRVALARAFYGDPRFVVLDEPNSNLDTKGDKALARAIDHAKKNNITVIVITQKPSLLSVVDKIMLLADGSVQLFGERTKVLQELAGRKAPKPLQKGPQGGTQNG